MPIATLESPIQEIQMPLKAQRVLGSQARYKVLYGGRGSGKSYSIADALLEQAVNRKLRILCTREMQNSIRDSVHRLLQDRIIALDYSDYFDVYKETIISKCGSEFIFKGLRHNIAEVKSTEGLDRVWCEEAEKISEDSWTILIPTVRNEGSEIWISFNPEDEHSATYKRFVTSPSPDTIKEHMTFEDNIFFPEVLRKEMEYCKRVDYEKYEYVWLGLPKKYGEALIFKNVIIEDIPEPTSYTKFYYGADFGFSEDPTCLIRMFIRDNRLYITHEAYGHGVEIAELNAFFRTVPDAGSPWKIIADSERPDTISHLHNQGLMIEGAKKGKGSVEDGIQFLRSFEKIVISPKCKGTIDDFQNYRWKRDRITDEILPIPIDKSNHAVDSARYGLESYVKGKMSCWEAMGAGVV